MAGNLLDIGQPGIVLPARIVVDSSLIVPRLRAAQRTLTPIAAGRARQFFRLLLAESTLGYVPPTAYSEVLHYVLKAHFRDQLAAHRADLAASQPGQRGFDWLDLYKLRPALIAQLRPDLELLLTLLHTNGPAVIQSLDMQPLASERSWEDVLAEVVLRYHLDTSDAAILLEAQRAGITSIATLDADLRRAARDFDVYTWL
ncbi:MAG: hypothetical protein ACRDJH_04725 [Thermomicrobiales bacterium]